MNYMQILDRLVSIKSNAHQRAFAISMENPGSNRYQSQADTLESGINGLIMEIQNAILAGLFLQNQQDKRLS
ncbi:MAG: hypothetical protein VB084_12545 [Syntrophomonadaceae bacterium]|nr:hypothetical protein [Syntrophomonadaceae bacterium]